MKRFDYDKKAIIPSEDEIDAMYKFKLPSVWKKLEI